MKLLLSMSFKKHSTQSFTSNTLPSLTMLESDNFLIVKMKTCDSTSLTAKRNLFKIIHKILENSYSQHV